MPNLDCGDFNEPSEANSVSIYGFLLPFGSTMKIAAIGCGYWGKNLVRNFNDLKALHTVCDATTEGREVATRLAPEAKIVSDYELVLKDSEISGVAIATPAVTHRDLAIQAVEAGKDVFVEKPMALSVAEGEEMLTSARANQRVLMVGHLLEYHPAIVKLKNLIHDGELGTIQYIYSNRLNFGKIRKEENALWSFAPHDIAVILRLVNAMPVEVSCRGANYINSELADVTLSSLQFENNIHAHIFVSWLNPFKEQKLVVIGDRKMAVFDDVANDEKLVLYDQQVRLEDGISRTHKEARTVFSLPPGEPLKEECREFVRCIETREQPLTDGLSGLNVLKILESCQTSLHQHGQRILTNFNS